MRFLSPLGGLVALAVVAPLIAYVAAERNRRRVVHVLGLPPTGAASRSAVVTALVSIAALLGVAATQPTLVNRSAHEVRSDAAVFFVVDTSRSMLASSGPGAPTRFERERTLALKLRNRLPEFRVGLATMTDRVLPHLFPSADREAFAATLQKAVGVERPPPSDGSNTVVTTLSALTRVALDNFYPRQARHRLLVLFTDGESTPFIDASIGALFRGPPVVETVYVHLWHRREHVYLPNGKPEPAYQEDPTSGRTIARLAEATHGVAIEGENVDAAVKAARSLLGSGPKVSDAREHRRIDLAPYLALVVLAPLGFLLYRRNV